MTAVFIAGKTGPGTLTDTEAYRPVFSWIRFSESNAHYLNEIFYTNVFTIWRVLVLETLLLYVGLRQWLSRPSDPRWLFLWIWIVVTPLPITFLPGRGGAMLYIVLAGWAPLAALTLRTLARWLTLEPLMSRIPRHVAMSAALFGCIGQGCTFTRQTTKISTWPDTT